MKRKPDIAKIIAANTKAYRAGLGITQFQLAEKAGISTTYLAELEVAKKAPSIDVIEKLCQALGIRPYELFIEDGVDDIQNESRASIRKYAKEASSVASKAVADALQELAEQHLNS